MAKKSGSSSRIIDKGSNVKFKNKEAKFTMVSNTLIRDQNISLKAKGLYTLIQSYITIPNFQLYRSFLLSICMEGEASFDKAWKELQDAGYFVMKRLKDENNRFYYEYELLDEPKKPGGDFPGVGNPSTEIPSMEKPQAGNPVDGNYMPIIKPEELNSENKTLNNKINHLHKDDLLTVDEEDGRCYLQEGLFEHFESCILENSLKGLSFDEIEACVSYQIQPKVIASQFPVISYAESILEKIRDTLVDLYCETNEQIIINDKTYFSKLFKKRLLRLRENEFYYLLDAYINNPEPIKNQKAYLTVMLLNATVNQG